jgi:hypothetical protein
MLIPKPNLDIVPTWGLTHGIIWEFAKSSRVEEKHVYIYIGDTMKFAMEYVQISNRHQYWLGGD